MAGESLAWFDVKYETKFDKIYRDMHSIILSFITSSKIRQKLHNLRAFDEEPDIRAISEPTRVPSGG